MRPELAETIALQVLAHVAGDEDLLPRFVAETGLDGSDMAARAGEPEFQAGVLDFLLADEEALVAYCDGAGIKPEDIMRARQSLPGGTLPHWT